MYRSLYLLPGTGTILQGDPKNFPLVGNPKRLKGKAKGKAIGKGKRKGKRKG